MIKEINRIVREYLKILVAREIIKTGKKVK